MSTFEVLLEKKGRGRGFALARPWAVRTFKLKGQTLEYYDSSKLKGAINVAKGKAAVVTPKESDDKPFPFVFDSIEGERLFLNASCDDIRQRCIQIFNLAARDAAWTMPPERGHEQAAAEAAIGIMAAEAEKAKLLEEQKRLEEERLKEVTAATAKMMEEELANAKLREAKEAERRQYEEHQRQIAEMLKGMGAKARFFAALKEGQLDVAREAGAMMLQGAWRSKLAYRRMLLKKAEKEAKRRDACARKIQCRYRVRTAKRRVAIIKAEKQKIKERLAAIKFQCAWRSKKARRLYKEKKLQQARKKAAIMFQCAWRIYKSQKVYKRKLEDRMILEVNKSISRQRRIITMQSTVRRFLATRRVARRRVAFPMVVSATVDKVEGFKQTGNDMTAIVSGLVLAFPIGHPALVNPNAKVPLDVLKSVGKITSHYRVENLASKKEVVATALNQVDYVVVTIIEKNSSDFLGQAIVKVTDVTRSNNAANYVAPLHTDLVLPIIDADQKSLVHVRAKPPGTSTMDMVAPQVTLGLEVSSPAFSMCGWLWKVSESILSNAWKRRWFILHDDQLIYYNSELGLEASKNVINCRDVVSLKEDSYKGRHAWKITFAVNGVESFWMLDFDENESKSIKEMWLRKLRRCCPALQEGGPARSPLKSTPSAQDVKTRIPVSRRVSIFK